MQFVEFDGQLPCIHFGVVRVMVSRKQELKGLLEIRAHRITLAAAVVSQLDAGVSVVAGL